ncbi:MAG: NADH:flavin oxidoreductase [Acidobacteria bacterium]|nr:NADH:flavin oxidoreductase [Acidobacteriota bacterium]
MSAFPRVAALKTVAALRGRLQELGLSLACDEAALAAPESPLAAPVEVEGFRCGNRWVIHPMEGWDAEADGRVSDLVRRRWHNFARSGAKWLWGGEAMAVVPEGRANPRQLIINEANEDSLKELLAGTVEVHRQAFGAADDLLVGFQLTHSGRFCRPNSQKKYEPRTLYRHPVLDRKFGIDSDAPLLSDEELRRLIERYIAAARIAQRCGAHFVDVKHCHGYLGHEFLSAHTRPGDFGGSFENRTRFLREIVAGIRAACPGLRIGVRLSTFDFVAFKPDPARAEGKKLGPGIPEDPAGVTAVDLTEGIRFLELCRALGIRMINVSAGSPYYNPHIQRPALFPPSDGYQPPEDPLAGCVRQIDATAELKQRFPDLVLVGTGYTYLQEYLPHVAQAQVRAGRVDAVGLGRMVLSYPTLPADVLRTGLMNNKAICRTFSDCTTGPRNGLRSGCFPLDPFYRTLPDYKELQQIKAGA